MWPDRGKRVLVKMWQDERSPGADVAAVSPVPVQMLQLVRSDSTHRLPRYSPSFVRLKPLAVLRNAAVSSAVCPMYLCCIRNSMPCATPQSDDSNTLV